MLQLVFPPGKPDFPAPPGPEERVLEEGEGWEQAGICCSPALPRGEAQMRQELLRELPARNPIPEVFLAPGTCLRCSWVSLGWCSVCPHQPRLWLRPSKVPAPLGHQGWRGTTAGCVPLVPTPFSIPEMFLTLDVAGTKGPGCPERTLVPTRGDPELSPQPTGSPVGTQMSSHHCPPAETWLHSQDPFGIPLSRAEHPARGERGGWLTGRHTKPLLRSHFLRNQAKNNLLFLWFCAR